MRENGWMAGKMKKASLLGWLTNLITHGIKADHPMEEKAAVYASLECMANDLLGRGTLTPKQQEAAREFKLKLQQAEDKAVDAWLAATDAPDDHPLLSVRQKRVAKTAGAAISAALLLAACTNGGGEVTPTQVAAEFAGTQAPAAETLPASTPAPEETRAPEPAADPAETAAGLGLNAERTYQTEERNGATYLVDTYNDAPKAVLQEDGTWRRLDYGDPADAEAMYGHLVPDYDGSITDQKEPYLDAEYHGYRYLETQMFFLGEWEERQAELDGGAVTELVLKAGLRDADGLNVVYLVADAYGGGLRDHNLPMLYNVPSVNEFGILKSMVREDAVTVMKPGATLRVELPFPASELGVVLPPHVRRFGIPQDELPGEDCVS